MGGTLTLPVREPEDSDAGLRPFDPPQSAEPWNVRPVEPASERRWTEKDVAGRTRVSVARDDGLVHDPGTDWTFGARCEQHFDITEGDPESARITIAWTWRFRRDSTGFDVRTETRSSLSCTARDWIFEADCKAFENGRRVFARTWDRTIGRDLN